MNNVPTRSRVEVEDLPSADRLACSTNRTTTILQKAIARINADETHHTLFVPYGLHLSVQLAT